MVSLMLQLFADTPACMCCEASCKMEYMPWICKMLFIMICIVWERSCKPRNFFAFIKYRSVNCYMSLHIRGLAFGMQHSLTKVGLAGHVNDDSPFHRLQEWDKNEGMKWFLTVDQPCHLLGVGGCGARSAFTAELQIFEVKAHQVAVHIYSLTSAAYADVHLWTSSCKFALTRHAPHLFLTLADHESRYSLLPCCIRVYVTYIGLTALRMCAHAVKCVLPCQATMPCLLVHGTLASYSYSIEHASC